MKIIEITARLAFLLVLLAASVILSFPGTQMNLGGGTGYFVTNDGYMLTNRHVVVDAATTHVLIEYHGAYRSAEIVYVAKDKDVAVLKVNSGSTPCLTVSPIDKLKLDTIFTALILDMREGESFKKAKWRTVNSHVTKLIKDMTFYDNAPVHYKNAAETPEFARPGNSGSPVIDPVSNEVIGMIYGAGGINFIIFQFHMHSLLLQASDINAVIAESGAPIVCEKPTSTPINDTARIYVHIKE